MSFARRYVGLLLLSVGICFTGCTPPEDPLQDLVDVQFQESKVDDLSRTMDFVFSEVRFSQKEFQDKISTGLDRWTSIAGDRIAKIDWKPDTLSQPLIDSNPSLSMLEETDQSSFLVTDGFYIQESAWVSQIAKRVSDAKELRFAELYRLAADDFKPDEDAQQPLVDLMQRLHPDLDTDQAKELASSLQVFDWITRDIQLIPPVELDETETEEARLNDSDQGLAAAGVRGLGYVRYPYQVLLYGRGDYVERAKLFMLALRQINLDSVMLSVNSEPEPHPWAVAVAIGDQYFLFDTRLGLPIPGKKMGSIATLSELRSNPDLLTALDLTTDESLADDTEYWVRPEQIKELTALIYVTPESISKRMLALERALVGEERLTLAFQANDIEARLPQVDGVEVQAWDIAIKTHLFRQAVRAALEQTSSNVLVNKLQWHYQDEAYIDNFVAIRTARARFFKGKFHTERFTTSRSALESLQRIMYDEEEIDNLGSDKELQLRLRIRKEDGQSAQSFLLEVQSVQHQMRLIRRDVEYFLAQGLFDNGSVGGAGNWLERLRENSETERWRSGVTYLLGRSHEEIKEYDEAIEMFRDPDNTQVHGNLIRARMLQQMIEKLYAAE